MLPACLTAFTVWAQSPPPPDTMTILAAGDVLPHRRVKASARIFGWTSTFSEIQQRIAGADLAFANLESPIAPDHHQGIHGEVFDAPASLGPALAEAGFDVLSMANNHVWDQGVAGMLETRDRVRAAGMDPIGVGSTCAEAARPVIREVRGIRVAFLAMVDLLNADLRTTPDQPCVFVPGPRCTEDCLPDRDALFFQTDLAQATAPIRQARTQADLVVVSFHWQLEYRTAPLPAYRALAEALVAAGADVVLGHHPHVLQPVETIEAGGRRGLVAWSLGNLISDMGRTYDPDSHPPRKGNTRDGALLEITATRAGTGFDLTHRTIPLWTEHAPLPEGERIRVVPQETLPEPLRSVRAAATKAILGPR